MLSHIVWRECEEIRAESVCVPCCCSFEAKERLCVPCVCHVFEVDSQNLLQPPSTRHAANTPLTILYGTSHGVRGSVDDARKILSRSRIRLTDWPPHPPLRLSLPSPPPPRPRPAVPSPPHALQAAREPRRRALSTRRSSKPDAHGTVASTIWLSLNFLSSPMRLQRDCRRIR